MGNIIRHPLMVFQHTYQAGESTEIELHSLVTNIEKYNIQKKHNVAVLMEIQIFDSSTFVTIQEAMERHSNWIMNIKL